MTAPGAPRFSQVVVEQLNDAQKAAVDEIMRQSSAGLGGPYSMLLRSPELTKRYLTMTDYLRTKTSVPRRLNELAILIQARLWTSQYEWWAHYPLAQKAGLSEAVITDLKAGKRPASMQPDEAVVYDYCMELSRTRAVSDATYKRAAAIFNEQQIVDLTAVTGFYVMVSMMLNAGQVAIPNGGAPPLPVLPAS